MWLVRRLACLLSIALLHAGALWMWLRLDVPRRSLPEVDVMIGSVELLGVQGLHVQQEAMPSDTAPPALLDTFKRLPPPHLQFPQEAAAPAVKAITAAPQLDASLALDMRAYAARAGLTAGEGASVVLRVQVLKSGRAGAILVEVSSGRGRVDAAAIAYVRAERWVPARSASEPQTVWIRFGVHLQA